jgi:zinc transporter 5/7
MALVFHAMASIGLEQSQAVFAPSVTPTIATAASTLGACMLALPLYLIRKILVSFCTFWKPENR